MCHSIARHIGKPFGSAEFSLGSIINTSSCGWSIRDSMQHTPRGWSFLSMTSHILRSQFRHRKPSSRIPVRFSSHWSQHWSIKWHLSWSMESWKWGENIRKVYFINNSLRLGDNCGLPQSIGGIINTPNTFSWVEFWIDTIFVACYKEFRFFNFEHFFISWNNIKQSTYDQ